MESVILEGDRGTRRKWEQRIERVNRPVLIANIDDPESFAQFAEAVKAGRGTENFAYCDVLELVPEERKEELRRIGFDPDQVYSSRHFRHLLSALDQLALAPEPLMLRPVEPPPPPPPPALLLAAIDKARHKILSLKDNWDGEGALKIEDATWKRAEEFALEHGPVFVSPPTFGPGADGSIDIHWRNARSYDFVVNIPATDEKPIDYYGENVGGSVVRGQCDIRAFNEDLARLVKS